MAIRINVVVGQESLLARVESERQAGRTALTGLEGQKRVQTKAVQKRKIKLASSSSDAIVTTATTAIGTGGSASIYPQYTPSFAANRYGGGASFIVIANTNAETDDSFLLFLRKTSPPETNYKPLKGIAGLGEDENLPYLYVDKRTSQKKINQIIRLIDSQQAENPQNPYIWLPSRVFKQDNLNFDIRSEYSLLMSNVGNNDNGNAGSVIFGILAPREADSIILGQPYIGDSGDSFTIPILFSSPES